MLEEANKLKSNDGYITDSLGWALYKLKKYDKAKEFLKKAVQLMPSDPIVNDHFADILWMKGEKLPRGIELFIKNLTNTNTPDMASFILSQADKLGIKQSKLKIEYINSITDMNEEQRKAAWEESGY